MQVELYAIKHMLKHMLCHMARHIAGFMDTRKAVRGCTAFRL